MSDKQNKLNKNDDNIQFDKTTNSDQNTSDRSPINTGTAPLKRLAQRDPQLVALSKKPTDSSEKAVDVKLPLTGKLPDLSENGALDPVQSIEDDKLPKKPSDKSADDPQVSEEISPPTKSVAPRMINKSLESRNAKTETSDDEFLDKAETKKFPDSESATVDTPPSEKTSVESDLGKPLDSELVPEDTSIISKSPKVSAADPQEAVVDNSPKSSDSSDPEISFQDPTEEETDKPATYVSRSQIDIRQNRESFLTFSKKEKDESPEKNPDTAILPDKSPAWKKVIEGQAKGTTGTIGEQREVLFVIRGMIERVVMKDNTTATLGRFDTGTVPNEEIDLIPYGAIDRGVSRRHCEILLRDNQLHVVDLGSTNGTFLAGVRLKPNEATLLRKGDELLLGRLAVQVLFR